MILTIFTSLVWGFFVLTLYPAHVFATALVSIQPLTLTVSAGSDFTVDVNIADASDLFALQFDIGFVPGILSAMEVSEGTFLATAGTTDFFPGMIDNASGTITFIANTIIGAIAGASDDGVLATISFKALAQGTSPITVSNLIFLDSIFSDIIPDTTDGSVTVTTTVPEPATIFLLMFGMTALCLWRCLSIGWRFALK